MIVVFEKKKVLRDLEKEWTRCKKKLLFNSLHARYVNYVYDVTSNIQQNYKKENVRKMFSFLGELKYTEIRTKEKQNIAEKNEKLGNEI